LAPKITMAQEGGGFGEEGGVVISSARPSP